MGAVLSHKFVGQAHWQEIQAAYLCYSLEAQFFLQEILVFIPKDFNWPDESHSYYRKLSPSFKFNRF